MTHRAARAEFLLSGLLRCGHCRRAYVGISAKGNGGTYHYYSCSGRQKPASSARATPPKPRRCYALLITDLRVNSRAEILPTYRVATPTFAHRTVRWAKLFGAQTKR
jgi:hypothetical protein